MKAVILAGGLGKRLRPLTETIPKPLLPIGEKAILEIQIENLKKHGVEDIFLATNYKSEYIENFLGDGSRYGIRLKVSREDKPLGTVGPLTLLMDQLKEPFIVMNGDILTSIDFSKFHAFAIDKDADLTISIKKLTMPFAFGNIFFDGDYVTGIEEKPDLITHVLAGIYVMKPEIFDIIPRNQYFSMDHLINRMLDQNLPVAKYEMTEYWLDIGRVDDYEKAQAMYKKEFETGMNP